MSRPNVLWFSMEDTSAMHLGCYGDPAARTPHLDRIAREGARFDAAFSVAPVCAPSRHAIITGQYPTATGAHHMRTTHFAAGHPHRPPPYDCVTPPAVKCFPEYLRAAGYYCTNNQKTDYQFAPPFTAWDRCGADAHWRGRAPGQPFFAVFNPTVTHESGMWPEKGGEPQTDPAAVTLPPYLADTPETRRAIARHYDNVARSDARLGEILAELEADGLLESTIIVVWSDHGCGLPRHKRWPYDTGIRIPLLVRWPGRIAPGTVESRLVSLIDLAPTMLSLCGLALPRHFHGQPFLGPDAVEREHVFATRDRYDESYDQVRAVRDRRFKYVRNDHPELPRQLWIPYSYRHPAMQELWRLHRAGTLAGPGTWFFENQRPPEELYDTAADPWELHNLAGEPAHRATLERLRGVLDAWCREFDRYGGVPEREMVHGWWMGDTMPVTAAPLPVVLADDQPGLEPAGDEVVCRGPALLQLHARTQGASMGWTTGEGDGPWRLYTGPLRVEAGTRVTFRLKAIRIGFRESEERRLTIEAR